MSDGRVSSRERDEAVGQALRNLYWFFRMIDSGGPDGSDLDTLVYDEARETVAWLDAHLDDLRSDAP